MNRDHESLILFVLLMAVVPGLIWCCAGYRAAWVGLSYTFVAWLSFTAGQAREEGRSRLPRPPQPPRLGG